MTKILRNLFLAMVCMTTLTAAAADAEVTEVLNADFTQFTEGSPTSPKEFPSYGTGAFNSFFTSWFSSKVAQAGGALLIKDGGYVQTSSLNLREMNGICRITLKARAIDSYGGAVKFNVGYSGTATEMLPDDQWHVIQIIVGGGSISTRIKVEPFLSVSGILLEYLKVEQSADFIAAPQAQQPTQANGTSFTATWKSVTGATGYFLDVYSYDSDNKKVYFIQNEDCGNVRSKKVEGLDPETTYYFVVRATNGSGVSADSEEIEVVKVISSIATPEVSDATAKDGKVSFTWNPVADAEAYLVCLTKYTTLTQDATATVFAEDFAGVNIGTFSDIEFTYNYKLDQYTKSKGWDGSELGLAEGNIVLTPFSGATGTLVTPVMDLSANNGAFSVVYNLAEAAHGYYSSGSKVTVDLLDKDDNVIETKEATIEKKEYSDYSFEFTKGTAECKIQISYSGNKKLFIDDIKINQQKKAGDVVTEPMSEVRVEDTSYSFDYSPADNEKVGYVVYAIGRTVSSGEIAEIMSEASEEKFVDKTTSAIGSVTDDAVNVNVTAVAPGTLSVTTADAATVTVFDLAGRVILSKNVPAGTSEVSCQANGVVIVRVADKAFKILL